MYCSTGVIPTGLQSHFADLLRTSSSKTLSIVVLIPGTRMIVPGTCTLCFVGDGPSRVERTVEHSMYCTTVLSDIAG